MSLRWRLLNKVKPKANRKRRESTYSKELRCSSWFCGVDAELGRWTRHCSRSDCGIFQDNTFASDPLLVLDRGSREWWWDEHLLIDRFPLSTPPRPPLQGEGPDQMSCDKSSELSNSMDKTYVFRFVRNFAHIIEKRLGKSNGFAVLNQGRNDICWTGNSVCRVCYHPVADTLASVTNSWM